VAWALFGPSMRVVDGSAHRVGSPPHLLDDFGDSFGSVFLALALLFFLGGETALVRC
jgi:hypothetical protein